MSDSSRERFAQIVTASEEDLNLAEAALLIAKEEYPELDVQAYLRRFDLLAEEIRPRLGGDTSPARIVQEINRYLFQEKGFSRNTNDYYDPRNSFVNEVLDRKLGIPITLSVIYIEVGQRLGLSLVGVAFPGHFLVKYHNAGGEIVLDPFLGGSLLSQDDLEKKLREMYGNQAPGVAQLPQLLAAVSKKDILVRMLRNLKGIYVQKSDFTKALSAADRILLITPDFPLEVRDRGAIHQRLQSFQAALTDFRRYLKLAPNAEDAETVRSLIITLQRAAARLN
jgi:regulator of sirC expression with transglutaminase-like and TPR domain